MKTLIIKDSTMEPAYCEENSSVSSNTTIEEETMSSWETVLINCFENICNKVVDYLISKCFKKEFKFWGVTVTGTPIADFCLKQIIFDRNNFPIQSTNTDKAQAVLFHSIISQLSLYKKILNIFQPLELADTYFQTPDFDKTLYFIAKEATSQTLFHDIAEEYKQMWHSAEKIQIAWRKCIADPSYKICQQRLHKEFNNLVN